MELLLLLLGTTHVLGRWWISIRQSDIIEEIHSLSPVISFVKLSRFSVREISTSEFQLLPLL